MYRLEMGGIESIEVNPSSAINKIVSRIGLGLERREALLMQLATTGMVKIGNQYRVTYDASLAQSEP